MDFEVTVSEAGIEVAVSDPAAVEISVSEYTDADVRAVLLALLTDDTVLGRISGALAAVGLIPDAEAQAGTAPTPRIVTGAKLKLAIDALAVARVVALVGDTQLVTRSGPTLAGTTIASVVASAVAAVVDGALDGTLLTRSGSDVVGTSISAIIGASVIASLAEVLDDVGSGELLTRSSDDVVGTSVSSIVTAAVNGALAAVDAVGSGYLRASAGGGLSAVAGVPWADLTGVPGTFPPSTHNHTASEITDFATAWTTQMLAVLTTSGGVPYRTAVGGIGESKQGTAALGTYAIDWAAGHRFTKTLAGGDSFTHSNTEAKAAIYLVLAVNGQGAPSGIGSQVGGETWSSGWTTAYLWITKDGAGGLEYTLSGA